MIRKLIEIFSKAKSKGVGHINVRGKAKPFCPNCETQHIAYPYNYCKVCGQKLDWEG